MPKPDFNIDFPVGNCRSCGKLVDDDRLSMVCVACFKAEEAAAIWEDLPNGCRRLIGGIYPSEARRQARAAYAAKLERENNG